MMPPRPQLQCCFILFVLLLILSEASQASGRQNSTEETLRHYEKTEGVDSTTVASKIEGAFFGALVADALTVGSHYEYDSRRIVMAYGKGGKLLTRFPHPGEVLSTIEMPDWGKKNRVHPRVKGGDQTDYGEYNVLVLEHLATTLDNPRMFDVPEFIPHWLERVDSNKWRQRKCFETQRAVEQLKNKEKESHQLQGKTDTLVLRFASAFAYYGTEEECMKVALRTLFTHGDAKGVAAARYVARIVFRIIHGKATLRMAILRAAEESDLFIRDLVEKGLQLVLDASKRKGVPHLENASEDEIDDVAISSLGAGIIGKSGKVDFALPASLYLILKYGRSSGGGLMAAAKANVMVGGDSGSRAIAIGMVLGAAESVSAIPFEYQNSLEHWFQSEKHLRSLPLMSELLKDTADSQSSNNPKTTKVNSDENYLMGLDIDDADFLS